MKHFLYISIIFCLSAGIQAQSSFYLEASQIFTNFSFKDSDGTKQNKEYKGIFTNSYGIGYRYEMDFGLMFRLGFGVRNAGSNLVYDDSDYSWRLKYLEESLGIGYKYKMNGISPYLVVSGYLGQMIRGSQILNNEHFNITESKLMKTSDYGMVFSPGVEFSLMNTVSCFVEFDYMLGLANLEKQDDQKSTIKGMGLNAGIAISISK